MRAKLDIKINVPDNFTAGECAKCPIHTEYYHDDHFSCGTDIKCSLGYSPNVCPLEVPCEYKDVHEDVTHIKDSSQLDELPLGTKFRVIKAVKGESWTGQIVMCDGQRCIERSEQPKDEQLPVVTKHGLYYDGIHDLYITNIRVPD